MLKAFGIPAANLDLNRFFFATHTYFAILTKLLAYLIVGRYTDLPTPPINDWKDLPNDKLAAHFKELEKGGPFRTAGIRNFLEGDFFSWYTKFFTPELADCLREIVKRLADYDPATLDLAPAPTQDLLKKLIIGSFPRIFGKPWESTTHRTGSRNDSSTCLMVEPFAVTRREDCLTPLAVRGHSYCWRLTPFVAIPSPNQWTKVNSCGRSAATLLE